MNATQRSSYPEETTAPGRDDPVVRVLSLARRALTGRYRLAAPLALGLAVVGGIVGYSMSPPKYSSSGLLRVAPTLPKLLYANEQNQLPPAYSSMVSAHATLLSRSDFLERVMAGVDDSGWDTWGPVDPTASIIDNIEIVHRRGDEVVTVRATGRNPAQVRDAVNAVLDTHLQEQVSVTSHKRDQIDAQLAERAGELQRQAEALDAQILTAAGPYGGVGMLTWLYETRRDELEDVGAQLLDLGVEIEDGAPNHGWIAVNPAGATSTPVPALEAHLETLRAERVRLEGEIKVMSSEFGPRHRSMRQLATRLGSVTDLIAEYETQLSVKTSAMAAETAALRTSHAALTAEASELGRAVERVAALEEQRDRRLTRLEETLNRREELRVEANQDQITRVSIAARGEFPSGPASDRRVPAAAAGTVVGLMLGLGIVVLFGSMDRRCRSTADAVALTEDLPLLGVLPELKPRNTWLHQQAASGIHQIRNVLQIGGAQEALRTYCLTSSGPNEGKTSIALALAVSFAQSGQKTLVIDADLHGRGATDELKMSDRRGLRDAVAAADSLGCVHAGPVRDLWVIPAGQRNALTPERISAAALGDLLRSVRERYDAIIIDTAPLMGGPEAATICALADAVVLTVSRDCDGRLVNAAQLRLRQVGARYVGMVFNRATQNDFQRSSSCDQYIPRRGDETARAKVADAVESLRDTLVSGTHQEQAA